MNRKQWVSACIFAGLGLGLGACGVVGDADEPQGMAQTAGMALNIDVLGGSDVAGFRLQAIPVDCATGMETGAPAFSADESLQEVNLPGDNSTFKNRPYDRDSSHHFADHFFTVAPGCYNLVGTPLSSDGQPSEDCATATLYNQVVQDNAFNEFHLISQCRGEARTALDVLGSLNHPPEISLEIDKFMCAGAGVVACATASDPDGDPLEFEWQGLDQACFRPDVISHTRDRATGTVTECVLIPSDAARSLPYRVTVKDLAWANSCMTPIEDILPAQSGVDFDASKSRASLRFDTHALADCTPGAMAFIGVTLGADLKLKHGTLKTDEDLGMSQAQATQLAKNAINWVNPNLLGDADPRILLVRSTVNSEDAHEGAYIKARLEAAGFSKVDLVDEPAGGLRLSATTGYSVVWFVNPGWPNNQARTYNTLRTFRTRGGGVVVSGDDANQNVDLPASYDMGFFSFLTFDSTATNDNPNGTYACGKLTDNNQGSKYHVKFSPASPLAAGISPMSFPYGNDIDRNVARTLGETIGATTEGLTSARTCLGAPVPVMTTVPAGTSLP